MLDCLRPEWPAPEHVHALTTTRVGGVSLPPYDSLNLGDHVGDNPQHVLENRQRLARAFSFPAEPRWLKQVHGVAACCANRTGQGSREADASFTREPGVVCAVLTADCLPVLLCDRTGQQVAAIHAGWRGLLAGVIESTLAQMVGDAGSFMAWLGPAIGPGAFEVGDEVRHAFIGHDAKAQQAFTPSPAGRWLADIYRLARQRLTAAGVSEVYGGGYCTYSDSGRFYSYRRDGTTGRMATLIWME